MLNQNNAAVYEASLYRSDLDLFRFSFGQNENAPEGSITGDLGHSEICMARSNEYAQLRPLASRGTCGPVICVRMWSKPHTDYKYACLSTELAGVGVPTIHQSSFEIRTQTQKQRCSSKSKEWPW